MERPEEDWRRERRRRARDWRDGGGLWRNLERRSTLQRKGAVGFLVVALAAVVLTATLERSPEPSAQARLGEPVKLEASLEGLSGRLLVAADGRAVLALAQPAGEGYTLQVSHAGNAYPAGRLARGDRLSVLDHAVAHGDVVTLSSGAMTSATARP